MVGGRGEGTDREVFFREVVVEVIYSELRVGCGRGGTGARSVNWEDGCIGEGKTDVSYSGERRRAWRFERMAPRAGGRRSGCERGMAQRARTGLIVVVELVVDPVAESVSMQHPVDPLDVKTYWSIFLEVSLEAV